MKRYTGPAAVVLTPAKADVICTSVLWDQDNRENVAEIPESWF